MVRLTPFQFLSAPLATFDFTTLLLLCCLVLLASLPGAAAGPSTRYIDDQAGDSVTGVVPFYQGQWALGSNCPTCVLKPNPARTFMGTWHDTTVQHGEFKNMIITFTGTAINVFGIIPRVMDSGTTTNTNLSFVLDEKPSDTRYIQAGLEASNQEPFLYNQSVYSVSGLSNTQHTLRIEPQIGDSGSLFLFDYAEYTFDDGVESPKTSTSTSVTQSTASQPAASQPADNNKPTPVASIVIGVVIGVLVLTLLIFLLLWYYRRRRTGPVGHIEDRVDFSRKSPVVPVPITFHRSSSPSPSSIFSIKPLPKEPSLAQGPALSARSSLEIPTRSVTPSLSYAGSEPSRAPKTSEREAELERQLAAARAALNDASSSGGSLSRNSSTVTTFKRTSLSDADDAQLRAQVRNLQYEVDRLRATTRQVDAPPAYV